MARPRIFVSSTYYDLKHIRSSLELFIESVGYEPVLSEKGDIAYHPDASLDESCYREAGAADIFVLVVGGRYGSEVTGSNRKSKHDFFERYDSITRREYETASKANIPIYILIDRSVHAEYHTYMKNRENEKIQYAHVDSVNVFKLLEHILSQPRNNPVFDFEQSSQIEIWLREQWAGLFRDLLRSRAQQRQLSELTEQVSELKAVNGTLKNYLEVVMKKVDPTQSDQIIESEDKKIEQRRIASLLKDNEWFKYVQNKMPISDENLKEIFVRANKFSDIFDDLDELAPSREDAPNRSLIYNHAALRDANMVREILGLPHFEMPTRKRRKNSPIEQPMFPDDEDN